MSGIDFTFSVHQIPDRAEAGVTIGSPLTLRFSKHAFPDVVIFTGSQALTNDLADAINGVLAKHKAAPAEAPIKEDAA